MILKLVQRIWVESVIPVSHLPFVYVSASQPEGGELGICGIVITVLCYILVVITFPFSLFFCLKVSKRKALDCIDLNEIQWSLVIVKSWVWHGCSFLRAHSRRIWNFSLSKYGSMQWVSILRDFDCGWDKNLDWGARGVVGWNETRKSRYFLIFPSSLPIIP